MAAPPRPDDIDEVLRGGLLHVVHQPLVDLASGGTVGHEALLRGPTGTALAAPVDLLRAAAAAGRLGDLDLAAARRAVVAPRPGRTGSRTTFVNVEPSTLCSRTPELLDVLALRATDQSVVVEITERALAADPAGMLAAAEQVRAAGCSVALDDVGVEPASLAFIPLLRPEVVKLDMQLLRTVEDPATITVSGAVGAYAEASGAEVVAEGIETEDDLARAVVLGATLGQGWLWGRPAPVLGPEQDPVGRFAPRPVGPTLRTTPFRLLPPALRVRTVTKRLLLPVSMTVEQSALQQRVPPIVLSGFQHARRFGPGTARRYTELGRALPLVVALGVDMPARPAPEVRGGALRVDDELAREWTVTVLGAHEAVALVARDRGSAGPDEERDFDFVVTHDRELVTAVAHAMVGRLVGR